MNKKRIILFSGIAVFSAIIIIVLLSFSFSNSNHASVKRKKKETGQWNQNRELDHSVPPYHLFASGDTIHRISILYGVSAAGIVSFNRIIDERVIDKGARIFLPSGIDNIRTFSYPGEADAEFVQLPRMLSIRASSLGGKLPLTVDFGAFFDFPDSYKPVWDFGTGQYSFSEFATHTYMKPGIFRAFLTLSDGRGNEVSSNDLFIHVEKENMDSDGDAFITLDHVNAHLDLSGRFRDPAGKPVVFGQEFRLIQNPPLLEFLDTNRFAASAAGYAKITLSDNISSYSFYLFVSPFPAQFSVEPEYYWYKTQFDTGMYGNCGPACVAMAVHWATGLNISTIGSRKEIGLPVANGALSYDHMLANLAYHKIPARKITVNSFGDMKALIDKGNISIILFNTTYIQPVEGDETLVFTDRYYPDTTGHYIVIKGYTLDGKYLIIYDPIPGNWQDNSERYTDRVSMIGRNRYFLTEQIFMSIKGRKVIEIERKKI